MKWEFDEHRWDILWRMYRMSEFLTYDQMDAVSVYPVKDLIKNYGDIIELILAITERDTNTFTSIFQTKVISHDALDVILECAIDNDVPMITTLLLDYKYKHGEFKERNWDL